ncbi:MAG TPA: anhydro-N-acetylmuramic acid kinase, partial [Xanthomonadaceae bacterium]|nr:anhydro-N-acetylmuramic acid kinase [Xanthomonadaceae bacterium]
MADARALFLGLISGTSADGIDVALVEFDAAADGRLGARLHAGRTYPWTPALRTRLVALGQGGDCSALDELGTLDVQVADAFADAALALLHDAGIAPRAVRALGSHGQTVRHRPAGAAFDGRHPFTMQLGDGHRIAERTGITTVADFRRRDVAA